jgi:hypothetical protein
MSPFALTRTPPRPTSDHEEFPFHSEFRSITNACSVASYRGISNGTSRNVRHVTSAETSNASSSQAARVGYDVSAAVTALMSSPRRVPGHQ